MPNQVMRHVSDAVMSPTEDSGLSPGDARKLRRAVGSQAANGIVRAAGVQADAYVANTVVEMAEFVADTGLSRIARLSRREEDLIREAPLGEGRYRAVVDTYAALVAQEIGRLGRQR